jgi:5-methylcytosine-specific restriction endonuclease McrA
MESKQCSQCGELKPLTDFNRNPNVKSGLRANCKVCKQKQVKAWQVENREKRNARAKELKKHPRYQLNRNLAQIRFKRRHPDRKKADDVKRRAKHPDFISDLTTEQWESIKTFYGNACAYCGGSGLKLTQDHVVPIAKGGHHTASNIVPACMSCNCRKNVRPWKPSMMHGIRGSFRGQRPTAG